jgi:hypothetical protein
VLLGLASRLAAGVAALGLGCWQAAGQVNPRFRDRCKKRIENRDSVAHARCWRTAGPCGFGFAKKLS